VTYSSAPDFLRFTTGEDLADKVEKILSWKNRANYYRLVPELRKVGSFRFLELEQNVGSFLEVLDTPYGDPKRRFSRLWN
jgi:hypothetical protein